MRGGWQDRASGPDHLTGDPGDRAGGLYYHPGGFLLELRRENSAFLPWHSIPFFPVKILLDLDFRVFRGLSGPWVPQLIGVLRSLSGANGLAIWLRASPRSGQS